MQDDADIVLKRTKGNSMIRYIRTAQKRDEGRQGNWYELIDIPGGFKAAVVVGVPKDFNNTNKYPVIVHVYGGPGSQESTWLVSRLQLSFVF